MKKIIFIAFILLFPTFALADTGIGNFFSWLTGIGDDFWTLITVKTPTLFDRFWAYLLEWLILAKIYMWISAAKISWGVASVIIADLALGSQLNSLMGFLPNDVQAALVQLKLLDAIEMIIQAFIARFAMSIIN
jgi:hypothetical protein